MMTEVRISEELLVPCQKCGHIRNFHTVMPNTPREDKTPGRCCVIIDHRVNDDDEYETTWCPCRMFDKGEEEDDS